ncbi:TauD/TfdA family dioxygenase [Actinomycetospora endophytica]|uniref:TauD/TfdA family dioxygenase n=1 Tax=Actinomycetospora endophytica TaxID=2291215 RepID=A0ABS8PIW9_9PSEU|nr:TauD/TfdA family dioxygenase [Actinomycetospora endophytica]MCD2196914.1 TauD/TfdA family dioxygenase [Actinomycetospora endophytica]
MNIEALAPVGAEITGLAVGPLDDVTALRDLLAEHGVLVLPDQGDVDDERFTAFLRSFGDLAFTTGEAPLAGHPDLNVVSNVGRTEPPRSTFHIDTGYVARPPAYTALRAVEVPEQGGRTLFSNQFRAHDTLPDELRQRVQGRTLCHVVTGLDLGPDDEAAADHPVLRPHPVSGRVALYLDAPKRCAAVSGMGEEEAADTVTALLEHSTRDDNVHRHAWRPGDVVIWDNGAVMHRADHDGVVGHRVMHRGMVATYPGVS